MTLTPSGVACRLGLGELVTLAVPTPGVHKASHRDGIHLICSEIVFVHPRVPECWSAADRTALVIGPMNDETRELPVRPKFA